MSSVKAAVRDEFCLPVGVEVRAIDTPSPADDEVLVRVRASSLLADWYSVTGRPYLGRLSFGLRRPKSNRLGVDFAGQVEAIGSNVTEFAVGDEVFGGRDGAFAEYVCVRESRAIAPKPPNVTFDQAAATPLAAITALQGLRDKGKLEPGQRVLINGASGGVGTFAVQIAKALGAEVTAVCSTRNVELVRSLGADHVIDYTVDDFTLGDRRYDLMFDVAGSRSWSDCRRVLTSRATVVLAGGPKASRLLGPMGHLLKMFLAGLPSRRKVVFFIAKFDKDDMVVLHDLLETGKVIPAIDRSYPLDEIVDALEYMGDGHAQAKIVITM